MMLAWERQGDLSPSDGWQVVQVPNALSSVHGWLNLRMFSWVCSFNDKGLVESSNPACYRLLNADSWPPLAPTIINSQTCTFNYLYHHCIEFVLSSLKLCHVFADTSGWESCNAGEHDWSCSCHPTLVAPCPLEEECNEEKALQVKPTPTAFPLSVLGHITSCFQHVFILVC